MKKVSGRRAVKAVLDLMVEADHLDEELVNFIDSILSDYTYNKDKKLSHSLESFIRFNTHLVDLQSIQNALEEIGFEVIDKRT